MMRSSEGSPVVGVLLAVLTLSALATAAGPDHLLPALLAASLAGALTLAAATQVPLLPQLVSAHHRSEVCRAAGVRSSDPDRQGRPRPRAPGAGS